MKLQWIVELDIKLDHEKIFVNKKKIEGIGNWFG